MKKKGFTLVELLAVIAILAILVIMALPAVLRMFNNARKDSFTNEVNTIIRTARQQYLLSGGTDTTWSNAEGSTDTLDLTGNSRLRYYVKMNNEGKITKLQVTNGDFQYSVTNNAGIDIASSSDVEEVTEENELVINGSGSTSYVYVNLDNESINIGDNISRLSIAYSNYNDAIDSIYNNIFFRLEVEDDIVVDGNIGLYYNDNIYYFAKGVDSTSNEHNKTVLKEIFGDENCGEYGTKFHCYAFEYNADIFYDMSYFRIYRGVGYSGSSNSVSLSGDWPSI